MKMGSCRDAVCRCSCASVKRRSIGADTETALRRSASTSSSTSANLFFATRSSIFALLPAAVLAVVLCGCATTRARVVEVAATRHTETVGRADKNLFLTDGASKILFQPERLPVAEQREEFYVRWTGAQVDSVKFEYRQVNLPNKLMEQTCAPNGRHWNVFAVRGDDFVNGGPVSAWRVSLWNGTQPRSERGKLLAEQKSALW